MLEAHQRIRMTLQEKGVLEMSVEDLEAIEANEEGLDLQAGMELLAPWDLLAPLLPQD